LAARPPAKKWLQITLDQALPPTPTFSKERRQAVNLPNLAANTSARSLSEAMIARMKTSRHPRCCPVCGHRFIPWRVWQIGRWSCIHCPSCRVRLTRQFDRQCFAIIFAMCILLVAVPFIQKPARQIVIGVLGILLIAIVDAATVRLRPAPR
jgi:hypothetical protein